MDVGMIIEAAGGPLELAKRLGVARTTVLDWRRDNKIPGSRIARIAEEYGLSAAELVKLAYPPRGERAA